MNFYGACRTPLAGGVSPLVVGGSCRTGLTLNVEVRSCLGGMKEMKFALWRGHPPVLILQQECRPAERPCMLWCRMLSIGGGCRPASMLGFRV